MTSDLPTSKSSSSSSSSQDAPLDEATVAVMDRLNLYDILVRLPMNHGDLGPNSHVGNTDHSCSRSMNKVPLSDFFAAPPSIREGQMNERGVTSSLWMSDSSSVGIVSSRQAQSETECIVDDEEQENSKHNNNVAFVEQEGRSKSKVHTPSKGMSPSDPVFLAMLTGFLFLINFSSQRW